MNILGLHIGHDATAVLLSDGHIVAGIAEERLSRVKYHWGFPYRAIGECLRIGGLNGGQVDQVILSQTDTGVRYYTDAMFDPDGGWVDFANRVPRRYANAYAQAMFLSTITRGRWRDGHGDCFYRRLDQVLRGFDIRAPITAYDHHTCHAASAYFTSGYDPCLVFTIDGVGDGLCATVSLGKNGCLTRLHQTPALQSPGTFYSAVTAYLGFKRNRHEGKITGLAAYGDPGLCHDALRDCLASTDDWTGFRIPVVQRNGSKRVKLEAILRHAATGAFADWNHLVLMEHIDHATRGGSKEEIAAAAQRVLEEAVVGHVAAIVQRYGVSDLALAGGVFANVKLNQRIIELPGVRRVFIHPNMGDGGLALGGALLAWAEYLQTRGEILRPARLHDVYFGPEYSDADIRAAIERSGLQATYVECIEVEVARLVAEGKIAGWFNGRMEYGPRALGNRSILASPTDRTINDWLNQRLRRTEFMPFAPSALKERAGALFRNFDQGEYPAEFMTITFDVAPEWAERVPAVTHVDGTARPQVVTADVNPRYHRILREYERLTGLPLFVNTSFNIHEEPIVCTPDDAIRSLQQGAVDVLAMGNWLVEGSEAPE